MSVFPAFDVVEPEHEDEGFEREPHEERTVDGFVWTTRLRPDETPILQRCPIGRRARYLYRA